MTASCVDRLDIKKEHWTALITGMSYVQVVNVEGLVKHHIQPRFANEPIIILIQV